MEAFEVEINGHHVCRAGIPDGVMGVIFNCVGGPKRGRDLFMSVGGLDTTTDEHLRWHAPSIGVGAEVLVRVVETDAVDPPDKSFRASQTEVPGKLRKSLREMSQQLSADELRKLIRELTADLKRQGTGAGGEA